MLPIRPAWIPVYLLCAAPALAQDRLTLADATARAIQKNHALRIEREGIIAANARALSARGAYDTDLRVEIGGRHLEDPTTSLFSGAPEGEVAPSHNTFYSSLSMSRLFESGAVASVSTSIGRDGNNDSLSWFDPAYTTSLGFDLRQPLLRNRAIDPARAALRVTALDRDRSGAALARQLLQTVSEVESAYWRLVAAQRDLEARRGNLTLAEQQRADTQARIQSGTVPASDLAQTIAEVERRRGDVFAAQEAVARAERTLKDLMLDDPADPSWNAEIVPADSPETAAVPVDVTRALAEAEKSRPELAEIAAVIAQRDVDVTAARDSLKPQLDLFANYTIRGLSGGRSPWTLPVTGLPVTYPASLEGGFWSSWESLGSHQYPDVSAGITFEIPLGRRSAHGQIGAAEAERRQSATQMVQARQRIAVEVRNAATALETAAGRIQAARAGLEAAQTQLAAEQERFNAGLTTNFFVLTRQNDLTLAQLAETSALTDYRTALTEFARSTGTLLRDRNINVE